MSVVLFEVVAYSTIQLFNNYFYRIELFAMKDLQIHETIVSGATKVTGISTLMERNVVDLALAGEQLYQLKTAQIIDKKQLDELAEDILVKNFSAFPEALGGGIWFEPFMLSPELKYFGPYAFRTPNGVEFSWALNTPEYDYHTQDWYSVASRSDWGAEQQRFRPVIWTEPYYDDAGTFSLMMTVDAVMLDDENQVLGLSTVDWGLSELTSFLDSVKITKNAVPFFIHRNSGLFLSFPKDANKVMQPASQYRWGAQILADNDVEQVGKVADVMIEDALHDIYYYTTHNGFVFGSLLPRMDLEADINRINYITMIAGLLIGISFILLMMLIIHFLFSPFDKVLGLIKNSVVRHGSNKAQVEIRRIPYKSENEFTPIVTALNDVNEQIKNYLAQIVCKNEELKASENEINQLNAELEKKVALRTEQLELKTQEALNSLELLKNTQNQFVENEKHAALGRLVAGIAHEINTPLGIAVTASSTLESAIQQLKSTMASGRMKRSEFEQYSAKIDDCVSMLNANLKRTADLIFSFKQVAVDQSTDEVRTFRVFDYLTKLQHTLQPRYKEREQQLLFVCDNQQLEICCNPVALTQVLSNLILNAQEHGLGDDKDGKTTVVVEEQGQTIRITVQDNGNGMTPEVRESIFEPFFTTTRSAGGTGLGLHIVYNLVVQQMGGTIECASEQGVGSVFSVYLPVNGKSLTINNR